MKKFFIITLAALSVFSCRHPEVEQVDFDTFQPVTMNTSSVFNGNGDLNPGVQIMENPDADAKLAYTNANAIVRNILGEINCNSLIHIAGIYSGHDVDGFPITLSGKLLLPRSGPIKNLIIVSHYTIGANFEAPSETFPLEGIWAAKGYAVAIADYIGYGVTADHIHPYMHTESTARSVVDMALAVKPYLKHIGREPESDKVILAGYSQGGATTVAVMNMIQDECEGIFPIKKVYAGGGPYDLAATYDTSMEWDETGIPCAIPMILQGINYGEDLGLKMEDFFRPRLLEGYEDWINSKKYTVKEINEKINATALHEILTDEGRNKKSRQTARLYHALLSNSVLNFAPHAPIFLFHSTQDRTVPFVNALKAEQWFKGYDVQYDFGEYGNHGSGCVMFIIKVFQDL